ncbi:AMP-binding protein [Spongisporangium articulatum]|uniref:AMP-binding protein n=1 Tax=Spongisporangium articulatum TaxID=3362603 RepID=A0ABW8AM95_9ACTN
MSVVSPGAVGRAPVRVIRPLASSDVNDGVLARLRAVVAAQPEALAVCDADRRLSYRELATVAAHVRARVAEALDDGPGGRRPGEPVGVLFGHHAGAVAAVLGVLASGHPLLVLDARTPAARLRGLAERVAVRYVLSDPGHAGVAAEVVEHVLVVRPDEAAEARPNPEGLFTDPPDPAAPAVLSFTSGSTGRPKVVVTAHRQLVGDAWANSTAGGCYDADDVVAHTLPMAFHAGLMATVAGPLVGATLALYDVRESGLAGLPEFLAAHRATVVHASPAILRGLVEARPDPAQLTTVRSLTTAGEVVHGRDLAAARAVLPAGCTFYNRYGSSETGLIAQYVIGPQDPTPEGPVPVGTPVGTTRVVLVDDHGDEVPAGVSGTVVVRREHLADGYAGDAAATRSAFGRSEGLRSFRSSDLARWDDAGRLVLLGRRDHSVKVRGYLVEPGEVDAVLFAMPDVREALVLGRPDALGAMRLVAYVVARPGAVLNAATVRARLRETLPAYMVPATVVFLEALPRTERGKLDRSALPDPPPVSPGRSDGSDGTDVSDWERVVADAFAAALGLDDLGLDDDFFELGGDSLAAEALVATLADRVGVDRGTVTGNLLAQAPTVRQFAARLRRRPEPGADVLVPVQPAGSRPPLFVAAGGGGLGLTFMALARALGPDQPVYALQARGLERRAVPDWSVAAIARRNVRELRRVQPHGPYRLAGHSFGGLVAYEMAQQLTRAGEEVSMLVVIDSFPPDPALFVPDGTLTWKDALGLPLTGLRGAPDEQYWRFYRLSGVLHRRYRGRPYAGPTVVLVAESPQKVERSAWGRFLTGPWRLAEVAGDHLSVLREPYVAATAAVIAAALEE